MLKKALAIMTAIIALSISSPGFPMDMGQFLDNTKAELQNAFTFQSIQGQERGYYLGGSARIRIPQETIAPLSITPPSFNAGCGGIDIKLGGLSYLDFEHLVEKLQSILQAAPTFAFSMALSSLCPQCDNIVKSLEQFTDMINQLQFDSCGIAKNTGGYVGTRLAGIAADEQYSGAVSGYFESKRQALANFKGKYDAWVTKYAGTLNCATSPNPAQCSRNMAKLSIRPSLLKIFFAERPQYTFLENILRAKVGDLYEAYYPQSGTREEGVYLAYVAPCQNTRNIAEYIWDGEFLETSMTVNTESYAQVQSRCQRNSTFKSQSFRQYVQSNLISLRNKIRNGSGAGSLTVDESLVVNSTSIPIWRILSLAATVERLGGDTGGILTDGLIAHFSLPISIDIAVQAYDTLWNYLQALGPELITKTAGALSPEDMATVRLFLTEANKVLIEDYKVAVAKRQEAYDALPEKLGKLTETVAQWESLIYKKLAENRLLQSYAWSKSAGK
jgi:conjugative transfer pilus assembly protein TraH